MPILPHLSPVRHQEDVEHDSVTSQGTVRTAQENDRDRPRSTQASAYEDFGRSPIVTRYVSQQATRQTQESVHGSATSQRSQSSHHSTQEMQHQRQVDRKRSRAAYLGSFRKACRTIFEAIEEVNNGQAVYDLRQEIAKRWSLYVSAHQDFVDNEELDEGRSRVYSEQHQGYKNEYEDTMRTLDAYLTRERKAQDRLRESIARQQAEKARLEAEIREIQRSVEKVGTAIDKARSSPRNRGVEPDFFGIAARRAKASAASLGRERLPSVREQLQSRWRDAANQEAACSASPETTSVKQRLKATQERQEFDFEDESPSPRRTPRRPQDEDEDEHFMSSPPRRSRTSRRQSDASSLGYSLNTSPVGEQGSNKGAGKRRHLEQKLFASRQRLKAQVKSSHQTPQSAISCRLEQPLQQQHRRLTSKPAKTSTHSRLCRQQVFKLVKSKLHRGFHPIRQSRHLPCQVKFKCRRDSSISTAFCTMRTNRNSSKQRQQAKAQFSIRVPAFGRRKRRQTLVYGIRSSRKITKHRHKRIWEECIKYQAVSRS